MKSGYCLTYDHEVCAERRVVHAVTYDRWPCTCGCHENARPLTAEEVAASVSVYVKPKPGQWVVEFGDHVVGVFSMKRDALTSIGTDRAKRLGTGQYHATGEDGRQYLVRVEGDRGE